MKPIDPKRPFSWSVGVCAHNEGTQADGSSRLRTWLQHWQPITAEQVVILHDCNDDSAAICAEFGVKPVIVQISGVMEVIQGETPIHADPASWHIRTGGIDEFMSAEHLTALERVIAENPDIRLYWIGRKNFCDGVDISPLLGLDWQLDIMRPRPLPLKYEGGIHTYPRPTVHASQIGMIDPDVAWIDHRRTLAEIETHNRSRNGFASPDMVQMQEQFIARVHEVMRHAKGAKA